MSFALAVVFLVFFVGGPLIFRALLRDTLHAGHLARLIALTWVLALAGLAVRFLMAAQWGVNLWVTAAGVLMIWIAWIGVLAFGAMVLRSKDPSARMHRWTAVLGAVGTTIPWFGLASANWIQG